MSKPKAKPARPREQLNVRLTPQLREHLEVLAKARGMSDSQVVKSAVMELAVPEGGVPSAGEVLELLGQAARAGSVSAMKELRVYHRERANEAGSDPLAEFDELAERRQSA